MDKYINKIIQGDCLEVVKTIPSESIDSIITSPPYWGLRDYGTSNQMGNEDTPEGYVANLIGLFAELRRTLKKEGTCWLNLGDSYYNYRPGAGGINKQTISSTKQDLPEATGRRGKKQIGLKEKDIVGIPWRVALALQADGWYLRQDIIWNKPNPMPESVGDRCTKSHEYVFLLTKSPHYYYDQEAVKEKSVDPESFTGRRKRNAPAMAKSDKKHLKNAGSIQADGTMTYGQTYEKRNKRSVWTVTTKSYKGAHFAVFPQNLIKPMVLAGCPKGGIVLDPFMGSGTTALVAKNLGRKYIGIELNPKYVEIAEERLHQEVFNL